MLNGTFHRLTETQIIAALLAAPRAEDNPHTDPTDAGGYTGPANADADDDAPAADAVDDGAGGADGAGNVTGPGGINTTAPAVAGADASSDEDPDSDQDSDSDSDSGEPDDRPDPEAGENNEPAAADRNSRYSHRWWRVVAVIPTM
jgi:hypothetical protein